MANEGTLAEIEERIAIVRDNLRQLTEQAAALSGAADEARASDRIAEQEAELQRLTAERDAILARRSAAKPKVAKKAKKKTVKKADKKKSVAKHTPKKK